MKTRPAGAEGTLPVQPAHQLPVRPEAQRWLVTDLWSQEAVGLIGGEPKCCKSFLALELAVAVASGTPCLRYFPVPHPGRVLLFAAEDALHVVRQRLDGICAAAAVRLGALDVHVITAPTVRLDLAPDRVRLERTVDELKPRLLVLDPFVRLHRIDENASGEVAPLLAYLRELQRRYALAVLLVHHAKKGGGKIRAGQALRGSSEFHAWGDSNLYLRRSGNELTLTVEHRAARSRPPFASSSPSAARLWHWRFDPPSRRPKPQHLLPSTSASSTPSAAAIIQSRLPSCARCAPCARRRSMRGSSSSPAPAVCCAPRAAIGSPPPPNNLLGPRPSWLGRFRFPFALQHTGTGTRNRVRPALAQQRFDPLTASPRSIPLRKTARDDPSRLSRDVTTALDAKCQPLLHVAL